MIVALVIVASIAALAVGGLIAVIVWTRSARDAQTVAERNQLLAESVRDFAIAERTKAVAERDRAITQLVATQKTANRQTEETARRVQDEVATGSASAAADVVGELLAKPLPGATADADGAGADHGDARTRPL